VVKLKNSVLCCNCDEIFELQGGIYGRCPACGSESFALISRWVPTVADFERWIDDKKGGDVAASAALTPQRKECYKHG
jgi:anaerobic ribonucleoside-triphosphate reductase